MRWTLSCIVALSLAVAAAAQSVLVVNPQGGTPYRSIREALWVARSGDILHLHPGTYSESIQLIDRAISMVGLGKNPSDVVLRARFSTLPFGITRPPANTTTRIANLTIDGRSSSFTPTVGIWGGPGKVVFDRVEVHGLFKAERCPTPLSLSDCTILSNERVVLDFYAVAHGYLNNCRLEPLYRNAWFLNPIIEPSTRLIGSNVEFSRCTLKGTAWGQVLGNYVSGGPALIAERSTVRITGLPSDTVLGGDGHTGSPTTPGGPAIHALDSDVILSGVTVRAGKSGNTPPIETSGRSTVQWLPTKAPVLSITGRLNRGQRAQIDLAGEANATSLTFLALAFDPIRLPFGTFAIGGNPSVAIPRPLDTTGRASLPVDLTGLPPALIGYSFAIQAVTLDGSGHVRLSGPRIGAFGN